MILLLLILGGCDSKALIPQHSLAPYTTSEDITLYDHERFTSSVPEHNLIPPHGKIVKDKLVHHLGQCGGSGPFSVCGETSGLGTDLLIKLYENENPVAEKKIEGKFGDGLFRFLGAPSAHVYRTIYFSETKIGVVHSFGFTLIRDKKLCDTVTLATNDEFSFGLTKNNEVVFIGYGPKVEGQNRVDGWRLYDEKVLCH